MAWNALPDDLWDPSLSADNFRKGLKTHLFRNALGHCALEALRNALHKFKTYLLTFSKLLTSCMRVAATICPRPGPLWWHDIRHVRIRIGHHYCMSTLACQYSQPKRPGDLDLLTFDLQSGVQVTCDVGYDCANFSQPMPLCSRVRPDVHDRQTSDKSIT